MKRAASFALVLVVAACGKRGDPRPPVPVIPEATKDLVVTQRSNRIVLSWTYPALTTTGRSLPSLRRIVVYRYSEELPPSATTTPAVPPEPAMPDAVAQFARVPGLTPVQFARVASRIDSIEDANLADATVGSRLTFTDQPPLRSVSGRPIRLTYAVVTEGQAARGDFSNLVSVVPLVVAAAPAGVTATADAQGVSLRWETPKAGAAGDEPVIIGYNVYRGTGDDFAGAFSNPINVDPVTETSFTDKPAYGEHRYSVTAVASVGPPRLESEPSQPAAVTFRDLVAPPPPASISALVETTAIRIVWDAVDAPDLAGYKLYRAEGSGQKELVEVGKFPIWHQPVNQTNFRDAEPQIGISYRYEVTSVDKSGNESAPVSTAWVLVPRTP